MEHISKHWVAVPQQGISTIANFIEVQIPDNTGIFVTGNNKESVAKLIAATPIMLEALQKLMAVYDEYHQLLPFNVSIAREALNKALGNETD